MRITWLLQKQVLIEGDGGLDQSLAEANKILPFQVRVIRNGVQVRVDGVPSQGKIGLGCFAFACRSNFSPGRAHRLPGAGHDAGQEQKRKCRSGCQQSLVLASEFSQPVGGALRARFDGLVVQVGMLDVPC